MKIIDLHNDFLTELKNNEIVGYMQDNEQYLSGLFAPVWTTELNNALRKIIEKNKILKKFNEKSNYKAKICIEDMFFYKEHMLDEILKIKPFYVGMCWNYENKFCGGAYSDAKLTTKGINLIKTLEKNDILIDCSHMNLKSYKKFITITQKPIFFSHTGFSEVIDDKRNINCEQIQDVVQSKGIIGLYFVGKYISKQKVNIGDIVKNIDYFANKFGIDNLCIGSDFFGTKDLPENLKSYNNIINLEIQLLKKGYSKNDIAQIFYKNIQNFVKNIINV